MAAEPKRLTLVVTEDMELLLARAKKELFYDKTQSEMIRELLAAGLDAVKDRTAGRSHSRGDKLCDAPEC